MARKRTWTNVFEPVTDLLGRDAELERIEALYEEGARLVTLRGTAGVGKSRCAVAHASSLSPARYPGGVFCVGLRGVVDEVGLLAAMDSVLPPDWRDQGPTFVVLDDCDESASSVARALEQWLPVAPALRCLVTSRTRLGVAGEEILPIEPLGVDAAIELFRQRSRSARGEPLSSEPSTTALLPRIVAKLDCLPLAIELAASRTVALEPAELIGCLDAALDLLVSDDPVADRREKSLRSAIELSWELLDPSRQRALEECAVFHGDVHLADVVAVTGMELSAAARVIASLCDRSLFRVHRAGETSFALTSFALTSFAMTSFAMYGGVRELARRKRDARPDASSVWQTWATRVVGAAREARLMDFRPKAVAMLAHYRHDLLALAEASLADPSADPDAESLLGLAALARIEGPPSRAMALLDAELERGARTPDAEARLLHARALLRARDGRPAEASEDFERSAAIASEHGEEMELASVTTSWARHLCHAGDPDRATTLFEGALAIYARVGDDRGRGSVLSALAGLAHEGFDLPRARALFAESIALLASDDPSISLAAIRQNYGLLLQEIGDFEAAEAAYVEARAEHVRVGNRRFEGIAEMDLGGLALERGRTAHARGAFERALSILVEVGDRREIGLCRALLGVCDALLGAHGSAVTWFAESEQELRRVGQPGLSLALTVHRAHLDLALLRSARVNGEPLSPGARADSEQRVRRAIAEAHEHADSGDELRFAARVLAAEAGSVLESRAAIVASDGTWCALPHGAARGARVELASRVALPRILAALLAHHLERPGEPLMPEDLIRAGWPETRSVTRAARNRLHVAINTLRKLGLSSHLASNRGGYSLRDVAPHASTRGRGKS